MQHRVSVACAAGLAVALFGLGGPAPSARSAPPEAGAQAPAQGLAIFSINVQDFAYPEKSRAVVLRILDLHEKLGVPVDFYLTGTIFDVYRTQAPDLIARLKASKIGSVCYHVRPPSPYYTRYDWLGLRQMGEAEQRQVVRTYETHALDPATGRTLERAGGYAEVAREMGYAPYVAAFQADAEVGRSVHEVFRELGAPMVMQHGRAIGLGEKLGGTWLRPEHVDLKLFTKVGERAADVVEAAFAEARRTAGAQEGARAGPAGPYFVGIKMHDNDFIAEKSAWTTVYLSRRRVPPWDATRRATPLSAERAAAVWSLYEDTVRYVAAQAPRLGAIGAPGLLARLGWQPAAGKGAGAPAAGAAGGLGEPAAPAGAAGEERVGAGAAPPALPPGAGHGPLLYLSGTMHIESKRSSWPEVDALRRFFERATAAGRSPTAGAGMRWSVGADIGWLRGEPRAAELIRALEALGVQWDVHAHEHADRAACAAAIAGYGGHPTHVASGALLEEVERLRTPVRGAGGAEWQAAVLWGTNARPGHGRGADLPAIGVWRPRSGSEFALDDPQGLLVTVGGGPLLPAGAEKLAQELAAPGAGAGGRGGGPPVVSATIMVRPSTLTIIGTEDGIAAIEAWAARVAALGCVRWATIQETAEAWTCAGAVPSRREVEASWAPTGPGGSAGRPGRGPR
ncbi:MAG: hypothetical protein HZA54_12520 [Planctomycetes bacterium]|nr:hypothetical protein [Planctomycetota bacterium]